MNRTGSTAEATALSATEIDRRYRSMLMLVAAIWLLGLVGSISPLSQWPAAVLYVIGGLALTLFHCRRERAWVAVGISRRNLRRALIWGGSIGVALMLLHGISVVFQPNSATSPMAEMESMLLDPRLLLVFPILILAEEFVWRGMALSALRDRGWNIHLAVIVTTLAYALNHLAVAPVDVTERALMAMMAIPVGILGGYLTWKLRNVWAAVIVHMLTFLSMLGALFLAS
ncbi:MAG: type II CAAX endopeptidase family protein [Wenzhouxiangella sp.]|jgi:membrane protease YdiL (CAAX protease family)|nr:type II CAAX endopeptidase family protein [Wenzhouxiangella sp.]